VQLKRKILSYFLLSIYLLVVGHQSIAHRHGIEFGKNPISTPSIHQHEDFKNVHHEHHFHVGIFHFLGHLLEKIDLSNDFADDHLVVVQKTGTKKVVGNHHPFNAYFDGNGFIVFEVDAESLPDPPYHLPLLQKLKLPSIPLRAPPSFV